MTCQIDCNNGLQPFSIYGLLKMLSGNAEPCNTEISTDKRLIVFKIPFIETSEIVLGCKLKKNKFTTLHNFLENIKQSSLQYTITKI